MKEFWILHPVCVQPFRVGGFWELCNDLYVYRFLVGDDLQLSVCSILITTD